ncbi:MAG TPA: efflux RND transporter periplasmic adaptor subunit [Phycisphaerae bacterium]|nr:efflux RND transporter periplasmic adaptor subunit [Phycisphaerae bacterium]
MKYHKRISMMLISAAALAIAACEPAAQPAAPAPPKVSVAHPETRDYVEADDYNGWISADQSVDVRARVSGHLQSINFTDGQLVKKDQVLFQIDPRPFEADVARATDQLHIYEAQVTAAQKEEARLKELQSKGGSSQSQVDKAEADRISLEAQVEGAKHEIDRAKLNLEYARITAPFAGRISNSILSVGNLVNAGGSVPVLTTIVSIDPVFVNFSIDERAMQRYMNMHKTQSGEARSGALKASQLPFQFQLETEKDFPHEGILDFIDNQVDQQTGTINVRGTIPNPQGLFVPGSRVKIRVPISASRSVMLVPDTAILSDQDKRYVLALDDKNVVQRRDISTGKLLDDGMRIVLPNAEGKNLSPDDWIVVLGIQSARINYPVEPIKPSAPPATTMASQ